MYCKNCGVEIGADARFCTSCGAAVQQSEPETVQMNNEPVQNFQQTEPQAATEQYVNQQYANYMQQTNEVLSAMQGEVLKWGILGLVFACSFMLSFLGIIFSAIAKKKARNYVNTYGQLDGRAKVGGILGQIGLIVGIVLTIVCAIYFIFCFVIGFAIGMEEAYSGMYYYS